MGQLFYQGVMSRDYPVVMGILVIGAFLTLLATWWPTSATPWLIRVSGTGIGRP